MNSIQNSMQNNMQNNNFPNFLNFRTMVPMVNMQNFQNQSFFGVSGLKTEFEELYSHPMTHFGLSVGLVHQNDYTKWRVILSGAKDTCYAGGLFKIMINFPNNYPNSAPLVYFLTPIYHLNVNPFSRQREPLGYVPVEKLDIWKPEYTMKEVLTYLYGLFYYADPNFGYGGERINEYKTSKTIYFEKVKYFVNKFAAASTFSLDWGNNNDWNFRIYD